MALTAGTRIGPYEVASQLGEGRHGCRFPCAGYETAFKMGNQAQGCERPDEERRVGNGVGEAQAAERRKRIKPVTEAVCPICRGPAGTKTRGSCHPSAQSIPGWSCN